MARSYRWAESEVNAMSRAVLPKLCSSIQRRCQLNLGRNALFIAPFNQYQRFVMAVPNTRRSVPPLDYQFSRTAAVVDDVRDGADATVVIGDGITDERKFTGCVGHIYLTQQKSGR